MKSITSSDVSPGTQVKAQLSTYIHAAFLFGLFFDPEDESNVSPKSRSTFNGAHGSILRKQNSSNTHII
jgi:hypothetical protein